MPADASILIRRFMGLRRDVIPTHLGPLDGVAYAQSAQNVTSEQRDGGISTRRGLARIIFSSAYTHDGGITGFGQITVAGITRVYAIHTTGTLRRYNQPQTLVGD